MALNVKPQSFLSYIWTGPLNENDTITVTLANDSAEPSISFQRVIFRRLESDCDFPRRLFILDTEQSDAEIVDWLYGEAYRVHYFEFPEQRERPHRDMHEKRVAWARKHVDFVIEPTIHDFQIYPNKQLILGQALFVHYFVDKERFVEFDGQFLEAGVFTTKYMHIVDISDNKAPLALHAS